MFAVNCSIINMNDSEQNKNEGAEPISQQQSVKGQTMAAEKPIGNEVIQTPRELNGPKGLEPTRYGDWEVNGRCYDF